MSSDPLARPEELIRRVYAYVAYRIGDGPEAEDVTGDVFERALRYRSSYDPAKGEPIGWLLGIARYRIAELAADRSLELSADPPDGPDPLDLEEEAIRRLTVTEALRALDERDRELIALRYGADLKASQIAELLGIRKNAVEVALHRALARLRRTLAQERAPSTALPARAVPSRDVS